MSVRLKDSIYGPLNGNANTASTLKTARSINGTNFNGSANITTANWGTARTITVGNTGKSVNGSGNISWSLSEIGAAEASHTHSYLPLSGGTLTGALALKQGGSTLTCSGITTGNTQLIGTGTDTIYFGNPKTRVILESISNPYVSINGTTYTMYHTGNKPTPVDIGAAAASHNHGLLHDTLGVTIANTTTNNGWSMINSSYNGYLLKSLRTQGSAPEWILPDYSAGIVFGGADTKGVLSAAYNRASVRFAGGNGSKPVWWFGITGSGSRTYNLDSFLPLSGGTLTGALISNSRFETSSYVTAPTLVGDKIQGRSAANRAYMGSGSCRFDTNGNYFRVFTSAVGANDCGLRVDPSGGLSIMVNSVGKHALNSDGSKYGGSIEIEGITYGMSPIDSPKFLIEDILFNVEIEESGTIINLNNIFAKSINGEYAVFVNNNKAEISDKQFDNFKVSGYTGKVDIRIVGKRIEYENEYFKIMGGFEHGTEQEISN